MSLVSRSKAPHAARSKRIDTPSTPRSMERSDEKSIEMEKSNERSTPLRRSLKIEDFKEDFDSISEGKSRGEE